MNAKPYPQPISLSLVGIDAVHDTGYTVDRRTGSDEYLFEFFDSPITLQDGRERRQYTGGVFILYAPGQRQYFRADGPLTHTWFQLSGAGVADCVERYQIPVNCATETRHPDFLAPMLREALQHQARKHRNWEDSVTEVCRNVFRRLSRALFQTGPVELSPYQKQALATLRGVRAQVYKDLQRRWTVEDMAALANMSAQRFAVAYRSCFGTGPIDDLIDVRLRHTEMLLRHLPITVVEAAQHFGFNTGSNFHVLFRERMGRSPRKSAKARALPAISSVTEDQWESSKAAKKVDLLYLEPAAHWSFNQLGAEIVDELGKHSPAVLSSGVTKIKGRNGNALHFDGTGHAVISETVIDTSRSYTVSAWLRHDRPGRMTAVSIGNLHHGAFYLQYITLEGGFKFAVTVSERDPLAIFVTSSQPSVDGEWRHVIGVHDAEQQEIRLYIDGALEGRTAYATPWSADCATYLGGCEVMDTIQDRWFGSMDDVRIYDRALSDAEIVMLYQGDEENLAMDRQEQ
ncbi:hypothetical protein CCAX7_40840 [Capsulimonas corticalis]|uniref:Uncharacterized protein n=1 Tax=Capsulimonas corticalis TaxID=2219043 RepID=A0A402D6B8_9BACT|nr:LamG-like jellyroll fold domain-containing protein [Capsulimonas corticalis]BDI32033.1 hypothetical protein CCAX7_40840 [Capsulimonas corticalis]